MASPYYHVLTCCPSTLESYSSRTALHRFSSFSSCAPILTCTLAIHACGTDAPLTLACVLRSPTPPTRTRACTSQPRSTRCAAAAPCHSLATHRALPNHRVCTRTPLYTLSTPDLTREPAPHHRIAKPASATRVCIRPTRTSTTTREPPPRGKTQAVMTLARSVPRSATTTHTGTLRGGSTSLS